jgi:TRAP-type C4-dicarboxylate transport system permease small subunit
MNDRDWEAVWEGTLDRVERYRINRSTWRRELPADAFERRLIPERARRLRRSASRHALFHVVWIVFWGSIAVVSDPAQGPAESLSASMAAFSAFVVAGCLAVRRYLEPVTRYG